MTKSRTLTPEQKEICSRDTVVLERLKCMYKIMSEDKNSTTFFGPNGIKSNPENEFNKCFSCDGYDMRCRPYLDYLDEMLSDF